MELKGLDREQQQQALDLESRFDSLLVDAILAGMKQGQFSAKSRSCSRHRLQLNFSSGTLKQWKFKLQEVSMEEYAEHIFENLLCA